MDTKCHGLHLVKDLLLVLFYCDAWEYDGGTKQKNFEKLREIRRAHGTLV